MSIKPATQPLPETYTKVGHAKASSWSFFAVILVVPFGWGPMDPAGEARDLAQKNAGGDALVDVTGDVRSWIIPIPFVPLILYETVVEGEAVVFK